MTAVLLDKRPIATEALARGARQWTLYEAWGARGRRTRAAVFLDHPVASLAEREISMGCLAIRTSSWPLYATTTESEDRIESRLGSKHRPVLLLFLAQWFGGQLPVVLRVLLACVP